MWQKRVASCDVSSPLDSDICGLFALRPTNAISVTGCHSFNHIVGACDEDPGLDRRDMASALVEPIRHGDENYLDLDPTYTDAASAVPTTHQSSKILINEIR